MNYYCKECEKKEGDDKKAEGDDRKVRGEKEDKSSKKKKIEDVRVSMLNSAPVDFLDAMPDDQAVLKDLCTNIALDSIKKGQTFKIIKSAPYIKKNNRNSDVS